MAIGRRKIDVKAAEVTRAYREWASPKTAAKRHEARERRIAVQKANIAAKAAR